MSAAAAPARGPLARVPLSVSLVLTMLTLAAVGLLVAGLAATAFLRGYLVRQVDDQLTQVAVLSSDRPVIGATGDGDPGGGARPAPPSAFYVQYLWDGGGTAQINSNPLSDASPPAMPALTAAEVTATGGVPFDVPSEDGGTMWRVVALPVRASPGGSQVASVLVAQSLASIEATVRRLAFVELGVGAGVVLLLGLLAWWLVRRSLRPLAEVEHTAAAIAAGDLSRRVPEAGAGTEVGRLSLALNGMLGRIESSFTAQQESEAAARESEARMRRFVGDASHELRTPLTSIRGFAELYRQGALPTEPDVERAMGRIEGEATRMGLLVDDMLLLARLDQQRALASAPVDLLELATDAVHDARAAAPERAIDVEVLSGGPPVVVGDEPSLRAVIVNLLGNAVRYSPPDSPVVVRVAVVDSGADGSVTAPVGGAPDDSATALVGAAPGVSTTGFGLLEVVDQGPGLPPEAAAKVFERFYRTDEARGRDAGGSGLGLAIVAGVVHAHGGTVELDTAPGEGATFRVLLPLATP